MKYLTSITLALILLSSCNSTKNTTADQSLLEGRWDMDYITGPKIAFEGLYTNNKPYMVFNMQEKRVSGNTSCNSFSGPFTIEGATINFSGPIAMTKMYCGGEGESVFTNTLPLINSYTISDSVLTFLSSDSVMVMRFRRSHN